MPTPTKRKTKSTHRFNVILTESQYQRLKDYAEAEEKDMAEVVRELIKTLPMIKKETID
jgi:effector-binding domain-containing protein